LKNTAAVSEDSNVTGINSDESNNDASGSGAIYVYTRSSGVWAQQAYVKALNTEASDEFGYVSALSGDGNTLTVGARREDGNAVGIGGDQNDNSVTDSGAVYLY